MLPSGQLPRPGLHGGNAGKRWRAPGYGRMRAAGGARRARAERDGHVRNVRLRWQLAVRGRHAGQERRKRRDHCRRPGAFRDRHLLAAPRREGQQRARHRSMQASVTGSWPARLHPHCQPRDGFGSGLHRRCGPVSAPARDGNTRLPERARMSNQVPLPSRRSCRGWGRVHHSTHARHGSRHSKLHSRHARDDRNLRERCSSPESGPPRLRRGRHRRRVRSHSEPPGRHGSAEQGGTQGRSRFSCLRGQRPGGGVVREPTRPRASRRLPPRGGRWPTRSCSGGCPRPCSNRSRW